jgi:hypothetical protein
MSGTNHYCDAPQPDPKHKTNKTKAPKQQGDKKRAVRLSDLDGDRKVVAEWARVIMASELCTKNAFPDTDEAVGMTRECILQAVVQKRLHSSDDQLQGEMIHL